METEVIPALQLFSDVIQHQWVSPRAYPNPTTFDKNVYNVTSDLTELLQTPEVDKPVMGLASPSATLSDAEDFLKPDKRKVELTFHKAHQAAAWAIKSAMATSFFTQASLLWLKQI